MNKVILSGRMVSDPELLETSTGSKYSKITIAVDDSYHEASYFFRATVWAKTAEYVCNHIKKGDLVELEGGLTVNKFTTKDGLKRESIEIRVTNFQLLNRLRKNVSNDETNEEPEENNEKNHEELEELP